MGTKYRPFYGQSLVGLVSVGMPNLAVLVQYLFGNHKIAAGNNRMVYGLDEFWKSWRSVLRPKAGEHGQEG
jgi:hypothetical protein